MAVSLDDVLRVAALARLRLDPAEVERFTAQLNSILDHMACSAACEAQRRRPASRGLAGAAAR